MPSIHLIRLEASNPTERKKKKKKRATKEERERYPPLPLPLPCLPRSYHPFSSPSFSCSPSSYCSCHSFFSFSSSTGNRVSLLPSLSSLFLSPTLSPTSSAC